MFTLSAILTFYIHGFTYYGKPDAKRGWNIMADFIEKHILGGTLLKTCIYTFSGTGTALSIADQVRDLHGDATTKLIPVLLNESLMFRNETSAEIIATAPKIGFVFPNYYGGIPDAVQSFIRRLNMDCVQYIFSIVVAGGGQGYSLKFLQRELQRKGKTLNYGRYAKGISNYIIAGYYQGIPKDKQAQALHLLRERIRIYANEIKTDRNYVQRSNPVIFGINRLLSNISSRDVNNDTSDGDKAYSVSDRCTGCGTCRNVCQAGNIEMSDSKPSFQHKCYLCMACLQYCPQNAILYKGKVLSRLKYTHHDFPASEMARRILEERASVLSQ